MEVGQKEEKKKFKFKPDQTFLIGLIVIILLIAVFVAVYFLSQQRSQGFYYVKIFGRVYLGKNCKIESGADFPIFSCEQIFEEVKG
ncbi:MAG: hypothetical protein QXG39_00265 [Candidatus Aenigmatarchaeota archaeon]